jgi:hypothetical protein
MRSAMAASKMPRGPRGGNPVPIPAALNARCTVALLVEPDVANDVVILQLAAERDARLFLAPEAALV